MHMHEAFPLVAATHAQLTGPCALQDKNSKEVYGMKWCGLS